MQLEMIEDLAGGGLRLRSDHHQHPFLGLGEHDVVGAHLPLAAADPGDVDVDPAPAAMRQLSRGAGQAGGPQVLNGCHPIELVETEAGLA